MNNSKITYKLVFAIVRDPIYQWMLEPYAVQIMKNGMFAYNHMRVASNNIENYVTEFTESEYAVLQLLDECRNDAVARIFGQSKFRPLAFSREIAGDSKLLKRVVKYLRNKTDLAISILADNKIPIYFKGDRQDIISEKPILPLVAKLDVVFNFILEKDVLEYTIDTSLEGKPVKLSNDNTIILNYDPCWLIYDGKFIQINANVDGKKLQPFLTKEKVIIEASQVDNYLKRFVRQILGAYTFSLKGIGHDFYSGNPIPVLSVENSLQGNTVLMLKFRYGDVEFAFESEIEGHVGVRKDDGKYSFDIIRRNRSFEVSIKDWLVDNGLVYLNGASFQTLRIHVSQKAEAGEAMYCAINFVNDNCEILKSKGFNIDNVLGRDFFTGRIELIQQFSEDNDWFDLKIYVMFDDVRVPFSALRKNILENNRELVLPDGRIAILPSGWFSKFHDLALISKPEGEKIRVQKSQFSFIQNIVEGNNRVEQFIETSRKGDFPIIDPPENMLRQLRPYQQKGMSWFLYLHANSFGGCLSDDMGLGKTIQVLAFLLKVKQNDQTIEAKGQLSLFEKSKGVGKTSLIIMPLSLVHNWENEIRNTTPDLKVLSHTGLGRRFDANLFKQYDLVLTTYGTVRNDIEKLKQFPFRFIFLDESQYIKNPESKIFAAVSQLASEQRFVITGTPVENSLIDLWSQLQFVNPGLLGDLKFFRDRFYQPIEKRGSKSSEKRFRQIINPFILRRTKNEVAKELPSLTEKIHFCPMTEEQSEIYEKRKSEIRNYIMESTMKYGADKAYMIILSGLMRLRLIANHPSIPEKDYSGGSGKFDQVTQSIHKVLEGGHKLLIFSQFVKHLSLYASYLEEQNIPYLMLTGQTNAVHREAMIEQFQKDYNYPIFLISLKAGGVGLNLTAADFVFLLDPWWNPAVEQQAINRTHRIGQDKKVISYKFITENTIEEKIVALQQRKLNLFNNFVNYKMLKNISSEELVGLLDD